MPTKSATAKPSGVKALARLRAERDDFRIREREVHGLAAIELGEVVLKSADLALEPAQLSQLIAVTMRRGFDATMFILTGDAPADSPPSPARKSASNGTGLSGSSSAGHPGDQGTDHDA